MKINLEEELNLMIVEGSITTQPGPHFIKLRYSARYGSIFDRNIQPVKKASVTIRDSNGANYHLTEEVSTWTDSQGVQHTQLSGIYASANNFSAVVGESYTLLITTEDGINYTSLPEKAEKGAEIIGLYPKFVKIPIAKKKFDPGPIENNKYKAGIEVYASFQDDPENKNFYMWKNNGTYQILTYPEKYLARPQVGGPRIIPRPKDCCSICWIDEVTDRTLRLLKDNNTNGNVVTSRVAFIEDDGVRYLDKYLLRVELHSLNQASYKFFQLLKSQISIDGDVFDPPPATIRGNMINLTNPDENVIGYFRASDTFVDSIFLTKDMLLEIRQQPSMDDDCRVFRRGTTKRPPYW